MVKKQYKLTQKTKYFVEKLREILPSKISSIKVFLFIFFELFFVILNTENENCKILNVENEKKKKNILQPWTLYFENFGYCTKFSLHNK